MSRLRVANRGEAAVGREHAAHRCRERVVQGGRRRLLCGRGVRLLQLDGLVAKVATALAAHAPVELDDDAGARRAAVAVVLSDDGDPALLFIRRQVRAGDPWSGQMAFPGGFRAADDEPVLLTARRETLEAYIKRLEKLEQIATSFEGVEKAFAIQAGREIRIMVSHDRVDDAQAAKLAFDISRKLEKEVEYPGQIKVVVIRETRAVEYAR
jgi:ADP-ribose pyrophosphatase YjhB (NUDIX family)